MAKQGFRVMDSDLHVIEPRTLWELCKYVVAEIGDENLVLSTDWPHDDSRFPHSIDSFLALPHLSAETKRKVLWGNCARLYNLQPVSVESPGGN
ncbi:MAG: hypothetical protein DMD96_08325 [Candidatus Rokuibacteriota bacterium]|nr:MAG: hypothetical protein DMD96_08325 [Candidatus Rokubacteria bacterium]